MQLQEGNGTSRVNNHSFYKRRRSAVEIRLKAQTQELHCKFNRRMADVRQRAAISEGDKHRVVSAFEQGEDYVLLANLLGIKRSTA